MSEYANPNSLVSCDWLEKHLGDDSVVVVEVDIDTKVYEEGHIPGAVAWGWNTHLWNQGRRDILGLHRSGDLRDDDAVGPQHIHALDDHRQPHQRGHGDGDHHVSSGQYHFPHGSGNLSVFRETRRTFIAATQDSAAPG